MKKQTYIPENLDRMIEEVTRQELEQEFSPEDQVKKEGPVKNESFG